MSKSAPVPALSADDVQRLMRRASGRGHTGSRNRALVAAFAGAGVGVTEALALVPGDLDAGAGTLRVDGPRARVMRLERPAAEALSAWVAEREALAVGPQAPLFCTREGLPLEASYVRRLLARLGREAGIAGVVNARGLRESYAAARLAAGASLEDLGRELGHASVASTQRFVRQIGAPAAVAPATTPAAAMEAMADIAHAGLAVLRAERDGRGVIRDFRMEYLNPAAAGILGGSPEDLPGTLVSETFPNSASDGTYARWTELIETQGLAGDPRVVEAEGRTRVYRVRRLAIGDRIVMSFEDQGATRAAERALAQLQARQAAIFAASATGILVFDAAGLIVAANRTAHRILGVEAGGLVGLSPGDARWSQLDERGRPLGRSDRPDVITRTTGKPVRDRVMAVHPPDGRRAWLSVSTEAIEAGGGAPYALVSSLVDVGPLRRADARARAAEAAVALVHEATGALLLRCRPDGTILSALGPIEDLVGRTARAIEGGGCADPVDPPDRGRLRDAYVAAMASADAVEITHGLRDRTGAPLTVRRTLRAVRDPVSGEVEEVQSLLRWRP